MGAHNRGAARVAALPPVPGEIVVDVQRLSMFAFNAGLTHELAQQVLLEAPHWRYPQVYCSWECGRQPHVMVDEAWQGRLMLYCTTCRTVDLWV